MDQANHGVGKSNHAPIPFDNRPYIGITFVTTAGPRSTMKLSVEDGDEVTLRIGSEHILVRNVTRVSPGRYAGTICGFEPSHQTEFGGYSLDQAVEFGEIQIHTCG